MNDVRSLHGLIGDAYGSLSPVDRRLADLILNFPAGLPGYSASELARMASTSNAAVSRFVRRLGFANYEEMRRQAREEAESGTPVYLLGRGEPGMDADLLERHAKTASDNILQTAAGIDRASFRSFVDRLISARRVWIAGFRHGYPIANYLRWSLSHARSDIHLLPMAGDTFGEHLVDFASVDILVVFALRRRVPAVATLMRFAQSRTLPVALVTDPGMMTQATTATWVFKTHSQAYGPIDDHASALMFAHAITEQTIAQRGQSAHGRFSEIDAIHENLDEL